MSAILRVLAVVGLASCGGGPPVSSSPVERELLDAPAPEEGLRTLPMFVSPFAGVPRATNPFDHAPANLALPAVAVLDRFGVVGLGVRTHRAWDFELPTGTPLTAMADGIVQHAGAVNPFRCEELGREVSDQLSVVVQHVAEDGSVYETRLDHLSRVDVARGDAVSQGDRLGLSGNTGCSRGPHVHLEVLRVEDGRRVQVDPFGWAGAHPDPWASHPRGAPSVWLWQEPPPVWFAAQRPVDASEHHHPVFIASARYRGWSDADSPNNERIEIRLDPRRAESPTYPLVGWSVRAPDGTAHVFGSGVELSADRPIRLHVGEGDRTQDAMFWNLDGPVLPDEGGVIGLYDQDGELVHRFAYGLRRRRQPTREVAPVDACPGAEAGCVPLPRPGGVTSLAWRPDGQRLVVSAGAPSAVGVLDPVAPQDTLWVDRVGGGHGAPREPNAPAFLTPELLVFDALGFGDLREIWYAVPGLSASLALPPTYADGTSVAALGGGGVVLHRERFGGSTLAWWKPGMVEPTQLTTDHNREQAVSVRQDGSQIAYVRSHVLSVVDVATGRTETVARVGDGPLATGWVQGRLLLLDGTEVFRRDPAGLKSIRQGVAPGAFGVSPNGDVAVSIASDGQVAVFTPSGGAVAVAKLSGREAREPAVVRGPDGYRVAYTAVFAADRPRALAWVDLP